MKIEMEKEIKEDVLVCPGCGKPFFEVHKNIKGEITSSTFLDGANGFFQQSKTF